MYNIYDKKKIGNRLRQLRKEQGYSQDEMAEKCYLQSRQTYAKWEHGDLKMSLDDLITLCNIFDCDIGYLLCEYDTKRHVVADVQEQTGLSEKAITTLIAHKDAPIPMEVLSHILSRYEFYDIILYKIYRLSELYGINDILKQKEEDAKKNMDSLRFTEIFISEVSFMERKDVIEYRIGNDLNKLISSVAKSILDTNEDVKMLSALVAQKSLDNELIQILQDENSDKSKSASKSNEPKENE